MNRNTVVDLFCGCGGMSLGFSAAGFETVLGLDNDAAALSTFQHNHRDASVINENIERVSAESIAEITGTRTIDVIVGGPPCQGLSLSGPRQFQDPRNELFLSFVRITEQLEPSAFVLENVPGLLGLFKGKIKDAILDEFSSVGYTVSLAMLTAADYGVPQLRKRVFFVGLRNQAEPFLFPQPTNSETNTLLGNGKWVTCDEALSDLPPLETGSGQDVQQYPKLPQNDYQRLMRAGSAGIFNHEATMHTEKVKKIISLVPEGGNYKALPEKYRNSRNFHVAWTRYDSRKPAPTVDTGHRHHFHYKFNRVPTVRECARLQSFPDRFIFSGNKSQQYSQVGNAVPPLLAQALANEMLKCL
jgi:DNA (cytosine-5)-methyltransferase 1